MRLAPQETRTYLVTAVTAQRRSLFQVTSTAELFERTLLDYRDQGKFLLHAFVIMPDHFHALITPAPDVSLEKAMQFIKGGFSFRLKSKLDVWMRSFNERRSFRAVCGTSRRTRYGGGLQQRRKRIPSVLLLAERWTLCLSTCREIRPVPKGTTLS